MRIQAGRHDWVAQRAARKASPGDLLGRSTRAPAPLVRPGTVQQLQKVLEFGSRYASPIRPMGAGSASTPCTAAQGGTIIDMTGLADIIDIGEETVTVQAGMRLAKLADALAEHGLELAGGHDLSNRTVGGAVAGASIGPSIGAGTSLFSSQVVSLKLITPEGANMEVGPSRRHLLDMMRMSYGLLGVIHEVTLKVRPIQAFTIRRRRCDFAQFSAVTDRLARTNIGLRFFLMPFRDQVYLEIRRSGDEDTQVNRLMWKIKDWGESTVLPAMVGSMSRIVPIRSLRYGMIDTINGAGQTLFTGSVSTGSAAMEQRTQLSEGDVTGGLVYTTWCFPAAEFSVIVQAYREFCRDYYRRNRFRCDMPTVGYRVSQDRSALLSPSFDGPMFALRGVSTPHPQWQDFVLEFAEFAEKWNGMPVLNQTDGLFQHHVSSALGSRVEFFRKMRRRLDPEGRLLNPFLAQFFL